jgi:hypothetical protein
MNLTSKINKRIIKRKIATAVLISASVAAFATLGDDGKKRTKATAVLYYYLIALKIFPFVPTTTTRVIIYSASLKQRILFY